VVDTHCHLDSCRVPDAELIERAREAGITRLATVGMNSASIARALQAAAEHDEVFAIVGCHPHEAEGFSDEDLEEIERAATNPLALAVGETGLDHYRDHAPRADQRRAFKAQLALAGRAALPVVVHTREAEEDTFAMLAEHAADTTVVLHCFSAPDRVQECVDRGYVCSFAGNLTYPSAEPLREAARALPDELVMVETDSPYLAPVPLRGKPNEPANVIHTAQLLAELRGTDIESLNALVEENAARVFRW